MIADLRQPKPRQPKANFDDVPNLLHISQFTFNEH